MSELVTKTNYLGPVPVVSVSCPSDKDPVKAADIRAPVAALLAECDDIRNNATTGLANKVNRDGDDGVTGRITITPSGATNGLIVNAGAASNQGAILATGDGIGVGIAATGGTNAAGASFTAGGGNNFGGRGIGSGNEVGWEATGGNGGAGMRARAGTASTDTVPTAAMLVVDGGLTMTGVVSPKSDVDPGADFAQFPQSMVSSSAILESDGAGGFTVRTVAGKKIGFNVASWSGNASGVATVTFTRALLGNNYRMHPFPQDGYDARWNGTQNTGNFQFVVRNATTNATVDLTTTAMAISVSTIGY